MNTRDIATYLTIVNFCLSKIITVQGYLHYKKRQEENSCSTLAINGVSKLDQWVIDQVNRHKTTQRSYTKNDSNCQNKSYIYLYYKRVESLKSERFA